MRTTTLSRAVIGLRCWTKDPRLLQISVLSGLLVWGIWKLDFPVTAQQVATLAIVALGCQWLGGRGLVATGERQAFDFRSPLISALSLSLLLRSNQLWVLALAAALAIGSKLALRWRGKHLFNPANFGLLIAVLLTGEAWISPGQWGGAARLALLLCGAGMLVVYRAARSDVSYAFLGVYCGWLFARSAWLGDPWAVPLHSLDSGALLLFAFFMISDPKTTPDSRSGRLLYAAVVATTAAFIHFALYRPNGFLWAILFCAPLVPILDRLLPGRRYRWRSGAASPGVRQNVKEDLPMRIPKTLTAGSSAARGLAAASGLPASRLSVLIAMALALAFGAETARAFCGFYVAKADTKLFNRASQVVLVRDQNRTVITMANDFRGEPEEFALVVPVPTFIERRQIHVAEQVLIDHLDAYTSPRLVEYFDGNPCWVMKREVAPTSARLGAADASAPAERELGVVIEAKYTVGEYDILILSAEESRGLETWLRRNGYTIPEGAREVLGSYLRQGMRFFVAKVNLDQQAELGYANLRPLQVAFESEKFMLPIRLGTVNADGPQELFVYTLTRKGRVETTNYRTVRLPTGMDLPLFVKDEFDDFYRDMFTRQVEKDRMRAVYLEYAWDMAWCDPCAADPLSAEELRELGVFWVPSGGGRGPAQNVFVTRLHLRYDGDRFPQDLQFQETADRSNFQGRYVLRHPWRGEAECPAASQYLSALAEREEREARTLASLTGWDIDDIRRRMGADARSPSGRKWWERLWPGR